METLSKKNSKQVDQVEAAWRAWRKRAVKVVLAVEKNDGVAVSMFSDEDLLVAESHSSAQSEHQRVKKHGLVAFPAPLLIQKAVEADADRALSALLSRPALLAGRCQTKEDLHGLLWSLAKLAIKDQKLASFKALLEENAPLAWHCAGLCLPALGDPEENDVLDRSLGVAWAEGYKVALRAAAAVAAGSLNSVEEKSIGRTIERGLLLSEWTGATSADPRELAIAAAACLAGKDASSSSVLAGPLLHAACRPGPARLRAWALSKKMDVREGIACNVLGLPVLTKTLKKKHYESYGEGLNAKVEYPALIDPSWVCASFAIDEAGVRLCKEMAEFFDSAAGSRPRVLPNTSSLEHPLARVWDVWVHSRNAGFALPKHPLQTAETSMRNLLAEWEARVGTMWVEPWRKTGERMLSSLRAGRVPVEFPGFDQKPLGDKASRELSRDLAPIVRYATMSLHGSKKTGITWSEEAFVNAARASATLGFSLEECSAQLKGLKGIALDSSWLARAQAGILKDELSTGGKVPPKHPARRL